ncbi:FmdB family zinc ribbon protein [Corallococcus carmarthensis]|uniref:Zinc ribbon domain-containing protein n=1 Tax=Corallococcus carmarthensis TaxID=2316728 RepID=A0A3A8JZJ0_9BACT|nr:zinc ribbon domain-containing protein [Corallococcus carmarthensis]RKH00606.1 zinc ribbon domain-containing protein [Corallococcus carmarthensis]
MPIYEYGCSACGKTIDVLQKMSDPTPPACTACGAQGTLSKQVSRSSFHLKGGGWYSDLYGSTKKDGGGSSSSSSSSAPAASTPAASSSGSSTAASAPAAAPSTPSASGDKS